MIRAAIARAGLALCLIVASAAPVSAQDIGFIKAKQALSAAKKAQQSIPPLAPPGNIVGSQFIPFTGDSLIQGTGAPTAPLPLVFTNLTGVATRNLGIGGQTSGQIAARMGAVATTLTFTLNQIVSYVSRQTITAVNAGTPTASTGVLSTPADTSTRELSGTVTCGGVGYRGTLFRDSSENYSFRADNVTSPVTCGPNAPFVPDFDFTAPLVFNMGNNDYSNVATVEANIEAVFTRCAAVGNTQCYWMNILNAPGQGSSTGDAQHQAYVYMTQINAYEAALHPGHVLAWREWLVSQYNPSIPADVTAYNDDLPPPSLQYGDGSVHLNAAGYASGAQFVAAQLAPMLATRARTAVTTAAMGSFFTNPLILPGPVSIRCGRPAATDGLEVCGRIRLVSGGAIIGTDLLQNPISIMSWDASSSTIAIGSSNLQALTLSVNGGVALRMVSNVLDLQVTRSYQDRSYSYQAPAAAATVTMADTSDIAIVDPAGTLASLTIKLPTCSAAYDGKAARFVMTQAVTALTVTSTAGTVLAAPSAAAINTTLAWTCRGSNTTWYRMQ